MANPDVRLRDSSSRVARAAKVERRRLVRAPSLAVRSRPASLDEVREVLAASRPLRVEDGRLSAERVAAIYGLSVGELGPVLGRSRQSLRKAPAAESLQESLGQLERIARLRLVLEKEGDFLAWLRTSNPTLGGKTPLACLREKRLAELSKLVELMLTGTPL